MPKECHPKIKSYSKCIFLKIYFVYLILGKWNEIFHISSFPRNRWNTVLAEWN